MLTSVKLTVLFNEPFWIGVFEVQEGELYKVSKTTFGSEPKESDVLEFILHNYYKLSFSTNKVEEKNLSKKHINPKSRMYFLFKREAYVSKYSSLILGWSYFVSFRELYF